MSRQGWIGRLGINCGGGVAVWSSCMELCVRDDDSEIWCRVCLFLWSIRWPWRVFVQFYTGYTAPAITTSHHCSSFWTVRGGTVFFLSCMSQDSGRQDLNVLEMQLVSSNFSSCYKPYCHRTPNRKGSSFDVLETAEIFICQVKIASIYALYTTICFRSIKRSLSVFPVRIITYYTTKSFDVFNHKGLTVNTFAGETHIKGKGLCVMRSGRQWRSLHP